jgi:hypothetical protein
MPSPTLATVAPIVNDCCVGSASHRTIAPKMKPVVTRSPASLAIACWVHATG